MAERSADQRITEEDRLRADWYALLACLLGAPADSPTLQRLAAMKGDESELGAAVNALAGAAGHTEPGAVREEYFNLFIGVGQGELLPFGSYYLAGFLNEKPLARLRGDMADLGIARRADVKEPEDHIASLCEMMAGMITGAFGAPVDLARQRQFFARHMGGWAPKFFEDLEAAPSAAFYMPVGTIGRVFMAIESQAFEMAA